MAISSIELLFVLGLAATLAGVAVGQSGRAVDDARASGAARFVASRLREARMEAVARGRTTALSVRPTASDFEVAVYADGNGNGVTTADIALGIDAPLRAIESLAQQFPGVTFGTLPDLSAVDPLEPPPGPDPIRLGAVDRASFTPLGTSTAGSLYIVGRGRRQYVVRIFAETGRTRVLRYDESGRTWTPISGL